MRRRGLQLFAAWLTFSALVAYQIFSSLRPEFNERQPLDDSVTPARQTREIHEKAKTPGVRRETPWQLFTTDSLWAAGHLRPQQERAGDIHADLLAAVDAAVKQLNRQLAVRVGGRRGYTAADLLDGRYRHRPGRGSEYILTFAGRQKGKLETVHLTRPAGPLSVTDLEGDTSADTTISVVVPYYHQPQAFGAFLANVAHLVLEGQEQLQLVVVFYWKGSPAVELSQVAADRDRLANALRKLNARAGRQVAFLLEERRAFSRGHALLHGAEFPANENKDVLLFFCDVDMYFDSATLRRCRSNAAPGRSVYYPIVFSTFNPALRTLAWGQPKTSLWEEHPLDPNVGFWRDYGYGMSCQFRSDFQRVAGEYLNSDSWGGEDVHLFRHHQLSGIQIVRAPDPGLVHIYHGSRCGRHLARCAYSQMQTQASAATWAQWVLRLKQRQVKLGKKQSGADVADIQQTLPELDQIGKKYVIDLMKLIP